jgi:hypothetical protein
VGLDRHSGKELLREYLLRGGFFMADDFHGRFEWEMFEQSIKRVFPDRPIVDIPTTTLFFTRSTIWTSASRCPAQAHLRLGYKNGGDGGIGAHWRAIYDDKGRIMVAISYNSDLGDAWEWADDCCYPEKFSGLALRIGVNYVVYAMTH